MSLPATLLLQIIAGVGVGVMSSNEKARDGLFRELFTEQLKIVAVEVQITTQPMDRVTNFGDLAEVGQTTVELHGKLMQHRQRLSDLQSKMKLEDVSN